MRAVTNNRPGLPQLAQQEALYIYFMPVPANVQIWILSEAFLVHLQTNHILDTQVSLARLRGYELVTQHTDDLDVLNTLLEEMVELKAQLDNMCERHLRFRGCCIIHLN